MRSEDLKDGMRCERTPSSRLSRKDVDVPSVRAAWGDGTEGREKRSSSARLDKGQKGRERGDRGQELWRARGTHGSAGWASRLAACETATTVGGEQMASALARRHEWEGRLSARWAQGSRAVGDRGARAHAQGLQAGGDETTITAALTDGL